MTHMIIGHQKIINFLDKSIEKNRLAGAYLFCGPENVGKFTVALNFAKRLTGNDSKNINPHNQNFGVGINPDIIIITPETEEKNGITKKKDIKIEKIRELQHSLSLSAYFGKYKVAIIDGAEYLTISAQNALLKILEEPAENCVLILIAHNPEKILPTIKSRCVIKKFGLVKQAEISAMIAEEENKEDIIFWSLGRPGKAIIFQKEKKQLSDCQKTVRSLKEILQKNLNDKFILAEELSKNPAGLIYRLEFWLIIFRKNILGENNFLNITSEKALDLIGQIEKTILCLKETNANSRLALENLFLNF